MFPTILPLLVAALCVGILIGCVGIGGILLAPALAYLGGLDFHLAVATSMWSFLFTGVAGTITYARHGSLHWRLIGWLSIGVIPAAVIGARAATLVSSTMLMLLLAALCAITGISALRRPRPTPRDDARLRSGRTLSVGAVVGFGSALTGTGGPTLLIPILLLLGVSPLTAVGTSQVIQIPVAAFATVGFMRYGHVDFARGTALGTIAVLGVLLGAALAHRLSLSLLQRIVAVALIGAGVLMAVRGFRAFNA
ncbi:MAG: sulfite exporter TauE/SafE family protein [Chloroflexota bacterium]|nr:sulfite exporter TauE/SafE family protein [Chloroflexota bacterium]